MAFLTWLFSIMVQNRLWLWSQMCHKSHCFFENATHLLIIKHNHIIDDEGEIKLRVQCSSCWGKPHENYYLAENHSWSYNGPRPLVGCVFTNNNIPELVCGTNILGELLCAASLIIVLSAVAWRTWSFVLSATVQARQSTSTIHR